MRLPIRLAGPLALLLGAAVSMAPRPASAQVDARMLRYPAISADRIAFVYAGDVWVVSKAGGTADRLTSAKGEESFPRFSPDGSQIAFSGNYDGNQDIYVIPTLGGEARRVTHHPSPDLMNEWAPDGKSLLFASSMTSEKDRFNKLFLVPIAGGLPKPLPMPYGDFGALSADGKYIAYTPSTTDFRTWKRYRGGWMQDIWLFDLQNGTARKLTDGKANYTQPMWHGSTLYFMSDRGANERNNIWAMNPLDASPRLRQVTSFDEYDTRFPSIGPSDMVFENGGRVYVMPLSDEKPHEVKINVVTDLATLRPRTVNVARRIDSWWVSPTGKRGLIEARGDIFTLPAEEGVVRNLTNSSGVAERSPAWSPDGKWIAYFSDRTGEYELTVRPADGTGSERTVTKLGPGFRYHPFWSPDSKKVAFVDQAMKVHVVEVATGADKVINKANYYTHGGLDSWRPSWSPDSRWLAYPLDLPSRRGVIFLYDSRSGESKQATSGFYTANEPTFDPDGKYLYFAEDRALTPVYGSYEGTWTYPNATQILAAALRPDVPSPLAPKDDEDPGIKAAPETPKADAGKAKAEPKKDATPAPAVKPVDIDVAGLEARAVLLPIPAGNYGQLLGASGKLVYVRQPRAGSGPEAKSEVAYWDLKDRKEESVIDGVNDAEFSADGNKALVRDGERFGIIDLKPKQKIDKTLALSSMEAPVNPMAEWKQMFDDTYRFYRDYFYDEHMHGVDWAAQKAEYGKLLADARTREDVDFVIGEFIAEVNSSHTYKGGGDLEEAPRRNVGLLGVDWALDNGAYRIKHIVRTAPWETEVRSPLLESGVNVKEGDYVLAVNGVRLDPAQDPWAAFDGLGNKTVQLLVNDKPTAEGARSVMVKTLTSEARLRNLEWIEAKRERVDQETHGRVGYIYVPSTGLDGQAELARQFYGQFDKDGLIVDERFNNGGQIPDRFVELLNRPVLNYWAVRDGHDWQWPPVAHNGPSVMLINGWSGSGGDAFPFYFKSEHIGPLVGTRTWGGLIGISGVPGLVDGGGITVPTFAIYSTDGKWIIEGHGVDPDIVVDEDPAQQAKGIDPQLEAGIAEVMRELQSKPPVVAKRPAPADRSRPKATPAAATSATSQK